MKISEIAAYLETRVPSSLKFDFDNVGLLCGFPDKEAVRALVALDITRETIAEALELNAQLIVSHHPLIFSPVKNILSTDVVGARIIDLLQGGLSAICLHTNLDLVDGGVNDALSQALGATVEAAYPSGRVAVLPEKMPLEAFLARVKENLGVRGLRYSAGSGYVQRIALCGGSGGGIIYEAPALGCDTVVTGEIRYNQWLDGRDMGLNLIDADHFCTENVVIPALADMLREGCEGLEVFTTRRHRQILQGF